MNQSAQCVHRRSNRVRLALRYAVRSAVLSCFAAVITSNSGCSLGTNAGKALLRHDKLDEWMVDYRNQAMAAKAWHCRKQQFCHRGHLDEFQAGFYAGYDNVACGGNGCTPAIVPKEYWGWKHQSADGQAGVNAWFEGYPMGVQAAETDGIGHWSQIRPLGLPGPAPGAAIGVPTYMDGGIPMEGMMPMEGAIEGPVIYESAPGGMSGSGVMLESGPQVLMNKSASIHRPTSGAALPISGSSSVAANVPATDTSVAPVGATSDQVNLTQSLKAVFGADVPAAGGPSGAGSAGDGTAGASASINDSSTEIPFTFQ